MKRVASLVLAVIFASLTANALAAGGPIHHHRHHHHRHHHHHHG